MDHRIVLISVVVAIIAVIGYLLVMRVFFRESKELDKKICLLYTSPSPRDGLLSRMPSSA